ncbi:hypothetical protein LTR02_010564 [Friedmanniomyces endolithicus]|nr:hypothetical protein LTR94_014972 [Friedmanniomyces endolithicus]KAK0775650.1 hypothetical protein LTR38_015789 [Friedmanniomyces endolithicus]KAK0781526.1 hypothetical protein LTR75_014672 [Friedmanniomyces endolithicus]KAK0786343.1 hypothetical protein LTR59_010737 [Friedmanniomyces endolithicus]KAK0830571.1 hypothetical protein LTR03_015875 [Friedmanniomyces endolithicus]
MPVVAMDRQRIFRYTLSAVLSLAALVVVVVTTQFLLIPIIIYFWPQLETPFYDLGFFGAYPTRDYVSFNLSSPRSTLIRWDDSCDRGNVFIDPGGPSPDHRGPMILDGRGNLVWTSDQYETTTNLKVQRYRGSDYLTFWSGHKAKTMGTGSYYMLDNTYSVVHKVDAIGNGLRADLHEFKITSDDTALLTVYNKTQADLTKMGWFRGKHGWIIDSVFQEVDIADGRLLFEWKASDHFSAADTYMTNPFGGYSSGIPFDFFHINSIEKDRNGNYLISSRHFHTVMSINGVTGEVMWQLGGHSEYFTDLSNGLASDFSWQHDARWLDEEAGILTLFDNGVAWPHVDAPYSQGKVILLDLENRTAELLHSYTTLQHVRSSSQGSVQFIDIGEADEHVFIGWGSSAAYTEHAIDGELLCETHFAALASFWWERVKSYRAFKSLDWYATPKAWDPSAAIEGGALSVSWNGATEVAFWELQGTVIRDGQAQGEWKELDILERDGFETSLTLPPQLAKPEVEGPYTHFRVAALDAERDVLRYSNIATRPAGSASWYVMTSLSAVFLTAAMLGYWQYRRRGWKAADWRQYAQSAVDRTKYQKLW